MVGGFKKNLYTVRFKFFSKTDKFKFYTGIRVVQIFLNSMKDPISTLVWQNNFEKIPGFPVLPLIQSIWV